MFYHQALPVCVSQLAEEMEALKVVRIKWREVKFLDLLGTI